MSSSSLAGALKPQRVASKSPCFVLSKMAQFAAAHAAKIAAI